MISALCLVFVLGGLNDVAVGQFDDDGGGDDGGFGGALAAAMEPDSTAAESNTAQHKGRHGKGKKGQQKDEYGGFDVGGAEEAIKKGGAGGLMTMLKAMTMLNHRDPNVKQDANGEDIYDFRDQDQVKRDRKREEEKEANKTRTTSTQAPPAQSKARKTAVPPATAATAAASNLAKFRAKGKHHAKSKPKTTKAAKVAALTDAPAS